MNTVVHTEEFLDKYRSGYPRYAALLSAHPSFQNFRRFTRIRMRLLLKAQDAVSRLEDRLDALDSREESELFLGCIRQDVNPERQQVMQELLVALEDYDSLLEKSCRAISMPRSWERDTDNLRNWTEGTGSVSRKETTYLETEEDLANLTGSADLAMSFSESVVEDCVIYLDGLISRYLPSWQKGRWGITEEGHILRVKPHLRRASRALAIATATVIVLAPTLVLPNVSSFVGRLLVSAVFAMAFFSVILLFTRAKTLEVFASGAR